MTSDDSVSAAPAHIPVMLEEALAGLNLRNDGTYLDGTFGRGGHAHALLARLGPDARLLLMDRDPAALAVARAEFGDDPRVAIRHGSFADLLEWDAARTGLDGVLLDLGVSSPQLDDASRGFSFQSDAPLDMRMDPTHGESAARFLARANEAQITDVLWQFGEERHSRRIARAIVERRRETPIERTGELADLIAQTIGRREPGKHPATRSFQALRIAVLLLLLAAVVASAVGVVYARQESRSMFVELTRLIGERDDLNFEYGRLELEQATAAEANRIEQFARSRFGMISPQPATTVIIKR